MKYLQDMMGFKKAIDKETGVEYILLRVVLVKSF